MTLLGEKPSYVGLLNAISCYEAQAHDYLMAWAETTPNPAVACVLRTIALREGEHGMSFAKRVNELGYELEPMGYADIAERMAIARNTECSDLDKFRALGVVETIETGGPKFDLFKDHSIDIRTGELLGRYIAEERDTIRLFASCYEQLEAEARATAPASPASGEIAALEAKVDALCCAVEELRQIVCGLATGEPVAHQASPA